MMVEYQYTAPHLNWVFNGMVPMVETWKVDDHYVQIHWDSGRYRESTGKGQIKSFHEIDWQILSKKHLGELRLKLVDPEVKGDVFT